MSTDPVTGGVGAPRDEALDEAVEAAARALSGTDGARGTLLATAYHRPARWAVEAAYPIIAAAVRADERAKVLREVEAAILRVPPSTTPRTMRQACAEAVRALASGSAT